ncbi:A24 family peptidase [Mycobacterium angelicum]|uniref:Prepilin peptidase n=1 Tax=Mycobacterium angelicum TaxID=470074 RepID=A0A1W9Z9C7_MYCAN|nr:A24 family peptidase [Mycobacterium angelicum]MCV7196778.1 prepilin peptidase [Mycobacterium angelicum]ORA09447.1 prepilin peptidase [Mycobacterium angelicum]
MRIGLAGLVVAWFALLSGYDIRQRRLPNTLTLPGAVLILLGAAAAGRGMGALAGAAVLGGVYLLVYLLTPAAMGAGDVKLAIGVGGLAGCFGIEVWFLAALAAPLLTALVGVGMRWRGMRTVPHGPSMCLATAAAAALILLT